MALLDQLVLVRGGSRVKPDDPRPTLVVEGLGGSGRSTFLRAAWKRWSETTPTASIDAEKLTAQGRTRIDPIVVAILLGLSRTVPHYPLTFSRVVVAYIAMREPIPQPDPQQAVAAMRQRLNTYHNRDSLRTLITDSVEVVGNGLKFVTTAEVGDLATSIARTLVDAAWMSRLRVGKDLRAAVDWFGHRDLGLHLDPVNALVELSRQIAVDNEAVRWDVEDLLVGALLADLRESMAGIGNRRRHALVLVDNGDAAVARAFTIALARVQSRALDAPGNHAPSAVDPLVVVAASGGALVKDLVRLPAPRAPWDTDVGATTGHLPPATPPGCWFSVRLGDLSEAEVRSVVLGRQWPAELGSTTVSYLTHRLTGGHAEATALVVNALRQDPQQLRDLDRVLRGPAPATPAATTPVTVEDHLFDRLVAGLWADGLPNDQLAHALVTLTAARDRHEAAALSRLVPVAVLDPLLTSDDLWSGVPGAIPPLTAPPTRGQWTPLVRYLGLRRLARRTQDDTPGWDRVFRTLRDRTASDTDPGARLHHELALGQDAGVVARLVELMSSLDDVAWLAVFDRVTATPDPRRRYTLPGNVQIHPDDPTAVVGRLVEAQRALSDPQTSDPATVHYLCRRLDKDFGHLAGESVAFLQRSQHYARVAVALS